MKDISDILNYIKENSKKEDVLQNQYLIDTFVNKLWKDIYKKTIINFLEGLDFYYLSNEAYFLLFELVLDMELKSLKMMKI